MSRDHCGVPHSAYTNSLCQYIRDKSILRFETFMGSDLSRVETMRLMR